MEITNYPEHEEFINKNERAVIFFGSNQCGHCRHMVPEIEKMRAQYPTVNFAHVEVTKVRVNNVGPVPIFVNYLRGVPVDIVLGADPKKLSQSIETKLVAY